MFSIAGIAWLELESRFSEFMFLKNITAKNMVTRKYKKRNKSRIHLKMEKTLLLQLFLFDIYYKYHKEFPALRGL